MKEAEDRAAEVERQKFEVEAIDNIKAVEDMKNIENLKKKRVNLPSPFFPFQQRISCDRRTKRSKPKGHSHSRT